MPTPTDNDWTDALDARARGEVPGFQGHDETNEHFAKRCAGQADASEISTRRVAPSSSTPRKRPAAKKAPAKKVPAKKTAAKKRS